MTRAGGLLRAVAVALVSATVPLAASSAYAADPVTVGLSGVTTTTTAAGSDLTGMLTLRSRSAVSIDAGLIKVKVDGTEHPVTIKQASKLERRAMLVIDTSGSMGAAGMATVRTASAQFLKRVPPDVMVGVASFANTAGVDLAPTLDRRAVQRVVDGLVSRGNTSLYAAIVAATASLGTTGDRSIVLLSDGADTMARNGTAALADALGRLRSGGVRVDVVRFKTQDPDATAALNGFAATNGGSVVSAADTAAVAAAFQASARALDQQVQFTVSLTGVPAGSHRVELAGSVGSTSFAFDRSVDVSSSVPAVAQVGTATPAKGPHPAQGAVATLVPEVQSRTPWVAASLLGLGLLVMVAAVSVPTLQTRREQRVADIESYVVGMPLGAARQDARTTQRNIADSLLDLGDKVMQERKSTKSTMSFIDRADLPFRAGEWLALRAAAVAVGAIVGLVLKGDNLLGAVGIGAALGLILPPAALRFLASRRAKKFERQLPDILMLVATSLKSGFGLPQALDAVARDTAEPASKEFSRALAETRIGTDITDALERMGQRMNSVSMRWTVMSIRIQRDVGGNLADTLRTTAGTLRERESLQRQVSTLSAEGRLSAYILIALPIFIFLYMMKVNYDYISMLWTTQLGIFMGIGGVVMLLVGVVWMRKVVKIEV